MTRESSEPIARESAAVPGRDYACMNGCAWNSAQKDLDALIASGDDGTVGRVDNSILRYAPVGNAPKNPLVIVCGKTPDRNTQADFISRCRRGEAIEDAAFAVVYSHPHTRGNLYRGLAKIGLFAWLKQTVPYWSGGETYALWQRIFQNRADSAACGMQLTQACDCAVITPDKNGTLNSAQPAGGTIRKLHGANPNCLFGSLMLQDALKLVVFLDTPSGDGQFHQEHFFPHTLAGQWCLAHGVKTAAITHPSGRNTAIYNKLDEPDRLQAEHPNAYRLFEQAKSVVGSLMNDADSCGSL